MDPRKRSAFNQTMHVARSRAVDADGTAFIKSVSQIGQNAYRVQVDGVKADRAATFGFGGA